MTPPEKQRKVLIVDDDAEFALVVSSLIEVEGHAAMRAASGAEALELLREQSFDAMLLDLMLGQAWGLDVLREARAEFPDVPVIVITAHGSMESAAEAMRGDAFDYIGKPFASDELLSTLRRAFEWRDGRENKKDDAARTPTPHLKTAIVGRSAAMVSIYRLIARVAATDSTILIVGESGTGKELIARAIHDNSHRARRQFVAVNCGAFTETLLESELFGHVRGAFTGASINHRGVFETASGGTIFLDEISETSPAFQVKLLRVLQEQEVRPVGASESRRVDVRIVAATNRRLQDLMNSDDFRHDLLYRLGVISIELPPLRERREDISLLADHFLRQANARLKKQVTLPVETINWLTSLMWPGNVRELENAMERAVMLNTSGCLTPEDFTRHTPIPFRPMPATPELISAEEPPDSLLSDQEWICRLPRTLEEVERDHILATLRFTGGNKLRAAELLGIGRYSLYRKAERLGIDLDSLSIRAMSEKS
ncbi:MAG TPA: sigma-54 dependent transcriptional regulator [Blastocatellia bacterium]|nr:sigma-54 dependent transcriptional regulator [Blastocatellia bacterium]